MTIINEFLVSLGVKVDKKVFDDIEKGTKKVEKSVKDLDKTNTAAHKKEDDASKKSINNTKKEVEAKTKGYAEMGSGLLKFAGISLTAGYAIEQFIDNVKENEQLYFMSKRLNVTAGGMNALSSAADRNGVSFAAISSTLYDLNHNLKFSPAAEEYMNQIGIETKDANGELLKTDKILLNMREALSKDEPFLARQKADFLGVKDDAEYTALMSGKMAEDAAEYARKVKAAGLDTEQLAEASHATANWWRDIKDYSGIYADKVVLGILKKKPEEVVKESPLAFGSAGIGGTENANAIIGMSNFFRGLFGAAQIPLAKDNITAATSAANTPHFSQIFAKHGLDEKIARAAFGSYMVETGGGNPQAIGDNGTSKGMFQWHNDYAKGVHRLDDIEKHFGKPISQISAEEQTDYVAQQLTTGEYKGVLAEMRAAKTQDEATYLFTKGYENPNMARANEAGREAYANGAVTINQTNNITGSSDPAATAKLVGGVTKDVVQRNVQGGAT